MRGKSKIEGLTNEWYGFTMLAFVLNLVLALFGSGPFAVVTVPLVIGFSVVGLVFTWAIGRLLVRKSSLTRIVLLVLSPIVLVLGVVQGWGLVTGPWSLGMMLTTLLVAGGAYMQLHSILTLVDPDVRAYFR